MHVGKCSFAGHTDFSCFRLRLKFRQLWQVWTHDLDICYTRCVISAFVLALGVFLGIGFASVIILPLIYGLPRAVCDAVRRRAVWWLPLRYVGGAVSWFVLLVALGYVSAGYAPNLREFMLDGRLALGEWIGVALVLFRCLTPNGRREMDADYVRTHRVPTNKALASPSVESLATLADSTPHRGSAPPTEQ